MIGRLALAQLRAYRTQSVWTLSLMTLLVAILTATVVMGATQARLEPLQARVSGWDKEFHATPLVGDLPGQPDLTMDEVVAEVQNNPGHDAVAVISGDMTPIPGPSASTPVLEAWRVISSVGEGATIPLASGRAATSHGEIVLAADAARELDAQIGGTVTLYRPDWVSAQGADSLIGHGFEVVGIAASTSLPGFDIYLPSAYISWEDAADPAGPLAYHWKGSDGSTYTSWTVDVAWNGHIAALAAVASPWSVFGTGDIALPGASIAWFGTAAVLLFAMIVMAFAVGRSQASQRAQWIATVRAMGARRSAIAVSSIAETLVLAGVAFAVGAAGGIGLAQAALTMGRLAAGEPFGPAWVSLHGALLAVAALAALVPALVIATVPAFWASRVAPTAALKPVNELTEAEVSRRVPALWAAAPLLVGAVLVALGTSTSVSILPVVVLGWICVAVGMVAVVVEGHRHLTRWAGRVLSRSSSPARMSAGDELTARPRQSMAPAVLATATVTAAAMWTLREVLSQASWRNLFDDHMVSYGSDFWRDVFTSVTRPTALATAIAGLIVVQVVASAIVWSHRVAARQDDVARAALGLSRRQLTATWWWVAWMPQLLGALVGLVLAALCGFTALAIADVTPHDAGGIAAGAGLVAAITLGACAAAAAGLALGAATSYATARLGRASLTGP